MDQKSINQVIGLVLSDEASEHEEEILKNWISQSEYNREQFYILKGLWQNTHTEVNRTNSNELFDKTMKKIASSKTGEYKFSYPDVNVNKKKPYIRSWIAASLTVIMITSALFFYQKGQFDSVSDQLLVVEESNPAGRKSRILLPDGSVVWLNSGSTINYPESFAENNREVNLSGEAFFEVTKDTLRPFNIFSGNLKTTVVGTSFNIKARENAQKVLVAVKSGKVSVNLQGTSSKNVVLGPNEMAIYTKESGELSKTEFHDAMSQFAWKEGILYFKNATLKEVFSSLEVWYNVSIKVEHPGIDLNHIYTGSFKKNETLRNVLEAIKYIEKFEYRLNGKEVFITKNK